MRLLEKQTVLRGIEAALIINKEIEIIDWTLDNPYVCGTCNYNGIIMIGPKVIEFHYSIFHKIFPHIFELHSMTDFEHETWRSLMAICFIKGFNIKIRSSNDFFSVLEIESGHYLSLTFEAFKDDISQVHKIIGYDEVDYYQHECSSHKDLVNSFLLPILNRESNEFQISFKNINDLTDDNLLMLSAFTF
jgi:hypothetical protein